MNKLTSRFILSNNSIQIYEISDKKANRIFITLFADLWRTSASPRIIFSFERTGTVWSGHGNRFLKTWIILHILNAEITYKEMQAHLQRLLERVSALHSLSAQPTTVRWLTAEEVCKALSITKRALQYYRSAGIIPYTALGNKVLFRDDDIRQLLEKNLIKSL